MNKIKNKLFVMCFVSFLLLPAFISNNANAALTEGDPLITDVSVIITGYDGVDQSSVSSFSDTIYNHTIPVIDLQADSFVEENQAPNDFATDGITRTYSDSLYTSLSVPSSFSSARGMYSVLQYIPENDFSQLTVERDITATTFTPIESFYTTVNDSMYAENAAWTAENYTVSEMYALISFDREYVDAFFAAAMAKDGYDLVTTNEYSTNQQMIRTLLDDLFTEYCYDIIYSPVNTTCHYSATWTVADEVRAVMGGNVTDTSINGTIKNVSVRNAMFGYLGQKIVPDSVVELGLEAFIPENDVIYGFSQTPTTYSIKFNFMSDYASSPLSVNLLSLFTVLTEADVAVIVQTFRVLWLESCLFGAIAFVVVGIATRYFSRKHESTNWISIIAAFVAFFIVAGIYILATISF